MYHVTPHKQIAREVLEERTLDKLIDMGPTLDFNDTARRIMEEKDAGRPGHYWGRDAVLEGSMPIAAFLLTHMEFDQDPDWYKDDKKFQDFMKRHPQYNWLQRR